MMNKTALSGIQPSGDLHLGNYLGSIKNWLTMQEEYNCYFFLADLHSITVPQAPQALRNSVFNTAALYIACGIDYNYSTIFIQSSVEAHAKLAWLLNCQTPLGWLKRMTQFKDKAGKNQDSHSAGLFTYPVLMAADILLYQANFVPVGDDQKQHMELTRDIAISINNRFGAEIFTVPEPMIQGVATRVMSLKDGTKKMSKSDPSDYSRINMIDNADTIVKKIQKAKTDSKEYLSYEEDRPEITNLVNIFSAISGKNIQQIIDEYQGKGFSVFKADLADVIINELCPIQQRLADLRQDPQAIINILNNGKVRAQNIASSTYESLAEHMGLL